MGVPLDLPGPEDSAKDTGNKEVQKEVLFKDLGDRCANEVQQMLADYQKQKEVPNKGTDTVKKEMSHLTDTLHTLGLAKDMGVVGFTNSGDLLIANLKNKDGKVIQVNAQGEVEKVVERKQTDASKSQEIHQGKDRSLAIERDAKNSEPTAITIKDPSMNMDRTLHVIGRKENGDYVMSPKALGPNEKYDGKEPDKEIVVTKKDMEVFAKTGKLVFYDHGNNEKITLAPNGGYYHVPFKFNTEVPKSVLTKPEEMEPPIPTEVKIEEVDFDGQPPLPTEVKLPPQEGDEVNKDLKSIDKAKSVDIPPGSKVIVPPGNEIIVIPPGQEMPTEFPNDEFPNHAPEVRHPRGRDVRQRHRQEQQIQNENTIRHETLHTQAPSEVASQPESDKKADKQSTTAEAFIDIPPLDTI